MDLVEVLAEGLAGFLLFCEVLHKLVGFLCG